MISQTPLELPGFGLVPCWDLSNSSGTLVSVMSYGATLLSVRTRDRDGKLANIALGHARLANYVTGRHFLGTVLGRYANRIKDGRFAIDGQPFQLLTNDGPNTLHGGPQGFDQRNWAGADVNSDEGSAIRLEIESGDNDQGFPGTVQATVTYILTPDNRLITDFTAQSDKPTPLNLSLHGYWNLAGSVSPSDLYRHDLQILSGHYLPVDSSGIPTGELRSVAGSAFDFRTPQNLSKRLRRLAHNPLTADGIDHCWAIDGVGSRLAAVLCDPGSGRELKVETDQPGIQVYTANHFNRDSARRIGEDLASHCAVALETQCYPDSPNQAGFPNTILRPGQLWRSRTVYSFAIR